jgi:outer membrane protein assembly factor BamB
MVRQYARDTGMLYCVDLKTGKEVYHERLQPARYRATPVLADGKIYLVARDGVVTVFKPGREFKILATNKMGDEISASPAISQGRIYLRGFQALYALSEGGK